MHLFVFAHRYCALVVQKTRTIHGNERSLVLKRRSSDLLLNDFNVIFELYFGALGRPKLVDFFVGACVSGRRVSRVDFGSLWVAFGKKVGPMFGTCLVSLWRCFLIISVVLGLWFESALATLFLSNHFKHASRSHAKIGLNTSSKAFGRLSGEGWAVICSTVPMENH